MNTMDQEEIDKEYYKKVEVNGKSLTLELNGVQRYYDPQSIWRNGAVKLPNGQKIDCGGGFIETEKSALEKNNELGISGGMSQGVWYPNAAHAGDFTPYKIGEDGSGWDEKLMPYVYENWDELDEDEKHELTNNVYDEIQKHFSEIFSHQSEEQTEKIKKLIENFREESEGIKI